MRKVLILSLLPFATLCACNKSTPRENNEAVAIDAIEFRKNNETETVQGKKLKLEAVSNVTFCDKNEEGYMKFSPTSSSFRLNYKVTVCETVEIAFGEPYEMIKVNQLYVDFYLNKNDLTPTYTFGGDMVQEGGWSNRAIVENIDFQDHYSEQDAYMHVRFVGYGTYTQKITSVSFYNLTVTSK